MLEWLSQYVPGWLASFIISTIAALWGVLMRLGHQASRSNTWVNWRQVILEIPTVFGMAIIAGPVGRYLIANYKLEFEIIFALCVVFGYLGGNAIQRIAKMLEDRYGRTEKDE